MYVLYCTAMSGPRVSRAAALAALLLVALASLSCLGCNEHLAGTHDIELVYRIAGGTAPKDAALAVKERLSAAQVYADVRPVEGSPDRLRLLLDDAALDSAEDLVAWRGGLALYRVDRGAGDRSFAGPLAEAAQRAARATPPAGHRVVLERTGDDSGEVRVVIEAPVLDLAEQVTGASSSGKRVEVQLTPDGSRAFAAHEAELSRGELLVTRGRAAYPVALDPGSTTALDDDRVVLAFAGGLPAYARAHATARLLATPLLPPLVFVEQERAPVDRLLATGLPGRPLPAVSHLAALRAPLRPRAPGAVVAGRLHLPPRVRQLLAGRAARVRVHDGEPLAQSDLRHARRSPHRAAAGHRRLHPGRGAERGRREAARHPRAARRAGASSTSRSTASSTPRPPRSASPPWRT